MVDLLPFPEVAGADLRQLFLFPNDDAVPLRLFLLLASLVGVALARRDRELADALPRWQVFELGVAPRLPTRITL